MTYSAHVGHRAHIVQVAGFRVPPIIAELCRADGGAGDDLVASLRGLTFSRNHVIIAEGSAGDEMYVVQSGKVKIGRTSPAGQHTLQSIVAEPEMFGHLSVFDPRPRAATATTLTEVVAVSMSGTAVRQCLSRRSDLAVQLLWYMARQVRQAEARLHDRVHCKVRSRLAKTLLELAHRFGTRANNHGGWRVRHDLTQADLAQYVGATRETVNRELAYFAKRGWIWHEGHAIRIVDLEALARLGR